MATNLSHSFSIKVMVGLVLLFTGSLLSCESVQDDNSPREAYYRLILADAPCLEDVCPGKDGRGTNSERLQRSTLVDAVYDNGGSSVNFTLINPDPKVMGNEPMGGGVLQFGPDVYGKFEIFESLYFNLSGLTLATAIDALGEPEGYLFISGCGMGYSVFGLALYPSRGIYLLSSSETRSPEQELLDAEKKVAVLFTTQQRYEETLLQLLDTAVLESIVFDLEPQVNADLLLSQIQPWPGLDAAPTPSIDLCSR